MQINIGQGTKLSDLATSLSELKPRNGELLAKKNDDGTITLYTRDDTKAGAKQDRLDKLRLTMHNGSITNQYEKKRALAQETISNLILSFGKEKSAEFRDLAAQGKTSSDFSGNFGFVIQTTIDQLGKQPLQAANLDRTLSSIEMLAGTLERLVSNKARQSDAITLPPTTNTQGTSSKTLEGALGDVVSPDLVIDGKTFVAQEVLGMGGNGAVVRYADSDGNSRAVKLPLSRYPENREHSVQKAAEELSNASRLLQGNDHVSGFSQHVPLSDGFIAIVGDLMPNGDLTTLSTKLKDALFTGDAKDIPSGKITEHERKLIGLTLLDDSAKGLAGVHEKGVSHMDMKSQNVMIGDDGKAKLIDLGESISTKNVRPGAFKFADAPMYIAPEAYGIVQTDKSRLKEVKSANREMFSVMTEQLFDSLGAKGKDRDELRSKFDDVTKALVTNTQSLSQLSNNSDIKLSQKFDSFGLGTLAFELFVGQRLTADKIEVAAGGFNAQIEKMMRKWSDSGANALGDTDSISNMSSGSGAIDDLLNGLLSSDPTKRLTPGEVSDQDIVKKTAGVGEPEVRDLIVALASNDPGKIDLARNALREKFPPLT